MQKKGNELFDKVILEYNKIFNELKNNNISEEALGSVLEWVN